MRRSIFLNFIIIIINSKSRVDFFVTFRWIICTFQWWKNVSRAFSENWCFLQICVYSSFPRCKISKWVCFLQLIYAYKHSFGVSGTSQKSVLIGTRSSNPIHLKQQCYLRLWWYFIFSERFDQQLLLLLTVNCLPQKQNVPVLSIFDENYQITVNYILLFETKVSETSGGGAGRGWLWHSTHKVWETKLAKYIFEFFWNFLTSHTLIFLLLQVSHRGRWDATGDIFSFFFSG